MANYYIGDLVDEERREKPAAATKSADGANSAQPK